MKICKEQHVPMDDVIVEKLSPPDLEDVAEKNNILEAIAEVCMFQRQYRLAAKKYTQSGNTIKVRLLC